MSPRALPPTARGSGSSRRAWRSRWGAQHRARCTRLSMQQALRVLRATCASPRGAGAVIARRILKEIRERLGFLADVGLDYLTLDRAAATLSGGEAQRIRLATQIGSGLVGVLYVLDEPSIGLHQRDNRAAARHAQRPARPRQHRASWSSTTRRPSAPPTTSSTWAPARACTAGGWSAEGTPAEHRQVARSRSPGSTSRGERASRSRAGAERRKGRLPSRCKGRARTT